MWMSPTFLVKVEGKSQTLEVLDWGISKDNVSLLTWYCLLGFRFEIETVKDL
jgi:hypothetical protein